MDQQQPSLKSLYAEHFEQQPANEQERRRHMDSDSVQYLVYTRDLWQRYFSAIYRLTKEDSYQAVSELLAEIEQAVEAGERYLTEEATGKFGNYTGKGESFLDTDFREIPDGVSLEFEQNVATFTFPLWMLGSKYFFNGPPRKHHGRSYLRVGHFWFQMINRLRDDYEQTNNTWLPEKQDIPNRVVVILRLFARKAFVRDYDNYAFGVVLNALVDADLLRADGPVRTIIVHDWTPVFEKEEERLEVKIDYDASDVELVY